MASPVSSSPRPRRDGACSNSSQWRALKTSSASYISARSCGGNEHSPGESCRVKRKVSPPGPRPPRRVRRRRPRPHSRPRPKKSTRIRARTSPAESVPPRSRRRPRHIRFPLKYGANGSRRGSTACPGRIERATRAREGPLRASSSLFIRPAPRWSSRRSTLTRPSSLRSAGWWTFVHRNGARSRTASSVPSPMRPLESRRARTRRRPTTSRYGLCCVPWMASSVRGATRSRGRTQARRTPSTGLPSRLASSPRTVWCRPRSWRRG